MKTTYWEDKFNELLILANEVCENECSPNDEWVDSAKARKTVQKLRKFVDKFIPEINPCSVKWQHLRELRKIRVQIPPRILVGNMIRGDHHTFLQDVIESYKE